MTKHTILFLATDPSGTDPGALVREARSIRAELKRSGYRDRFEFETGWAAEPLDLLRELRDHKPTVVHFSSRACQDDLFLQTANGEGISPAAIAETFGAAGASVRLVVLSACYREHRGEVLSATLSPDGNRVVTASFDQTARVWETRLDNGTLAQWSALAERSLFVLSGGVPVRRAPRTRRSETD